MGAIEQRVSVRKFGDEPVGEDDVRELLRAAMAAPSAGNQQPWEFYVVRDAAVRAVLSQASPYAKPIAAAPLGIVCCLRTEGVRWASMAPQDMAAATENILLKAAELGLGAVWLGIYPEQDRMEAVGRALGLPDGLAAFAVVAVGHPAGTPTPKGTTRYDEERVHWV